MKMILSILFDRVEISTDHFERKKSALQYYLLPSVHVSNDNGIKSAFLDYEDTC